MYELWEDENVLVDDIAEQVEIHDPVFAVAVAAALPEHVEELDGVLADDESYTKFFENIENRPAHGLAGINVIVGFDWHRKYDDIPGLGEDDTVYYADIYEVGSPRRGHNTIAFVAMISDHMDDVAEEYETMQWLYSRARELFMEETGIPDYYAD